MYEVQFFSEREKMLVNSQQNNDFKNDKRATLIIIVGESLRRDHLEYYGYTRNTTPYLNQEDIIVFTDAISPTNQTVNTLKRVFSAAEYENDSAYYKKPSFIKAFRETGFKTYWLSTQRMYGKHDSEVSFIAKESDSIIFRNNYEYDGVLIENLKDVLSLNDPKKLIIIHILGSHASYDRRYASEYNKFKKQEYANSNNKEIDLYDNSVLYNDFVLYNFLSELKKEEGNNALIMFSDHGESLFQSGPNRKAHSSLNPAKCEFEIPLVLWFSDEYKQNHPTNIQNLTLNKDQPVILSDFYHSVPSLYGIEFTELLPKKNFFGNRYYPIQNRKVMDNSFEFIEYNKLKYSYLDSD